MTGEVINRDRLVMDEVEMIRDQSGVVYRAKIIPHDADRATIARTKAYNRQAKKRALDRAGKQQPSASDSAAAASDSAAAASASDSAATQPAARTETCLSPSGRTSYVVTHGRDGETEEERRRRMQTNSERLYLKRKHANNPAPEMRARRDGRIDIQFQQRLTPKHGKNTYEHELSPADQLSPASRTRLQVRRAKRVFHARKAAERSEKKASWEDACDMYASAADRGSISSASQIQEEQVTMEKYLGIVFCDHPMYPYPDSAIMEAWGTIKSTQATPTTLSTAIFERSREHHSIISKIQHCFQRLLRMVSRMRAGTGLNRQEISEFNVTVQAVCPARGEKALPMVPHRDGMGEEKVWMGLPSSTAEAIFHSFPFDVYTDDWCQELLAAHGLEDDWKDISKWDAFAQSLKPAFVAALNDESTGLGFRMWAGGAGYPVARACEARMREIESHILSELGLVPVTRATLQIEAPRCSVVKTLAVPWEASSGIFLLRTADEERCAQVVADLEAWESYSHTSPFLASLRLIDPGTFQVEWDVGMLRGYVKVSRPMMYPEDEDAIFPQGAARVSGPMCALSGHVPNVAF